MLTVAAAALLVKLMAAYRREAGH